MAEDKIEMVANCSLSESTDLVNAFFAKQPSSMASSDRPVQIIVAAGTHSGKTLVSTIIEDALRQFGFTNVVVNNPEESPAGRQQLLDSWRRDIGRGRDEGILDKPIGISEVRAPFPLHK